MVTRKLSKKDKLVLLFVFYLLLAVAFFPLSLLSWYFLNRTKASFLYPLLALLTILGVSTVSYFYVFWPLARYHLDVGIWGAIVYGGMLTMILFASRFTYIEQVSKLYLISYYASYTLLIFSVISWAVIPSYYLARGIDLGVVALTTLGIAWVWVLIIINTYFSPRDEGVASAVVKDRWTTLFSIWVLTLGACVLVYLDNYVCRLVLLHG